MLSVVCLRQDPVTKLMRDLPARMSVLPDIHLSKAANVANPDHVNGEVAEEVNYLLF